MYFNYHAKIKNLIKNHSLLSYKIVDKLNNISPALVLFFKDHAPMPVRKEHFDEYLELINQIYKDKTFN